MKNKSTTSKTDRNSSQSVTVRHNEFHKFTIREGRYKRKRAARTITFIEDDGIKLPKRVDELLLEPKVFLHPEFAAFTFHLEGCPRNLLTYLIFYELDPQDGDFRFDHQTIDRFHEYCLLFHKTYTDSVVQQALRTLVKKNIVLNKSYSRYMVNPLLAGGTNEAGRRALVNAYTNQLREKGKDLYENFYPVYQKSR